MTNDLFEHPKVGIFLNYVVAADFQCSERIGRVDHEQRRLGMSDDVLVLLAISRERQNDGVSVCVEPQRGDLRCPLRGESRTSACVVWWAWLSGKEK